MVQQQRINSSEQKVLSQLQSAQTELQEYSVRLEQAASQRTRELEEQRDLADEANAAKSDFLAKITHELRSPMHGILSFARLGVRKSEKSGDEKLQQYFGNIEQAGERLLGLINNLLDLSKLESGHMQLNKEMSQLTEIINDELSALNSLIYIDVEQSQVLQHGSGSLQPAVCCQSDR